ncbi:hypothetical protein TNCV_4633841 [Trichonephila clavipes]|nr:hypothetical protein TNCV_4633841 [Trichonephila clavipes]
MPAMIRYLDHWATAAHSQDIISLINKVVVALRTCTLQWIPAQVDIFGNKQTDNLAKEARNSLQLSIRLTLIDADAISRSKLSSHPVKRHLISENCNRVISTIVARLPTRHFKGRKISPDGQRSYNTSLP